MHDATKKLLDQMVSIVEDYYERGYSMTVRQVYYQLVARNILPNNTSSYTKTSKILTDARMNGKIEWDMIVDRVRVPVMPNQFPTMAMFVEAVKDSYRTRRWADQKHYVEVMVEKEALAGILKPITWKYHVSLLVNKGYVSASAIHETATRIMTEEYKQKECHILYLGDHDPSGMDMVRDIRSRLAALGAGASIDRIALTEEQIEEYDPPPNPAKKTDPRSKQYYERYGSESWELDALDPDVLADVLEQNILKHMNMAKYNRMIKREEREKDELDMLARQMSGKPRT